jgi:hypothetical protein
MSLEALTFHDVDARLKAGHDEKPLSPMLPILSKTATGAQECDGNNTPARTPACATRWGI